jgi:hypothetical protein
MNRADATPMRLVVEVRNRQANGGRHREGSFSFGLSIPSWFFVGLLGCLLFSLRGQAAEPLPDATEVTRRVSERAQAVAQAAPGAPYTCEKRAVLEERDAQGKLLESEEKLYQVKWVAGLPFNRLIKVQGRDLNPGELKKQEEKEERFRQKFIGVDARQLAARQQAWVTPQLLARYQFAVRERTVLSNRATLVLDFKPNAAKLPAENARDRVLNRLAGTIWVDEADADVARVSLRLMEPVSLGWFGILGALSRCELSLDRHRLPDGVWVNARQRLLVHLRKLTATRYFQKTEESSGFKRATAAPDEP